MVAAASGGGAPNGAEAFAARYVLHEELGRGGMASVHRATDTASGRQVALKQLSIARDHKHYKRLLTLFEREFHTLAELRHPHVVEAYDYGLSATEQPYYTMELLDGGDLRDGAPWPWRETCQLLFQIASSLALIHSRRLLHRDVTPRNVRRTQDGHAKLIDFGAITPMSAGGGDVVGTPAFAAPEAVHRLALDARTDLFSLGVTLYYALTGELAYPARTFAQAVAAWRGSVPPPSTFKSDVPPALDELVLSLIRPDPRLRPQRAFDVMQRLAAIGGLSSRESAAVPRSYLVAPSLVGREPEIARLREHLSAVHRARAGGLLMVGAAGVGRSRLLDTYGLEAKTLGYMVLRAAANVQRDSYAVARALLTHLVEIAPAPAYLRRFPDLFEGAPTNDSDEAPAPVQVRDFANGTTDAAQVQSSICRLMSSLSQVQPIAITIDDVQRIDSPSAAIVAQLLDDSQRTRVFLAMTVDAEELRHPTVEVLASRCQSVSLSELSADQTQVLLESLFGDVANLSMLTREMYEVSHGNPQRALSIAQHLVDRATIRYNAGTWLLPDRLTAADLPRDVAHALVARTATLSERALALGQAQALAFREAWTVDEYRSFAATWDTFAVDAALLELEQLQALVSDGYVYRLANKLWVEALRAPLSPETTRDIHSALADLYQGRLPAAEVYHRVLAGQHERGQEALLSVQQHLLPYFDMQTLLDHELNRVIWCMPVAISTAERLGRSPRDVNELRRFYCAGCVAIDEPVDFQLWQAWLHQLTHDSGLDLYRQDDRAEAAGDQSARLTRALQGAHERYAATPAGERVYTSQEALQRLAEYVAYGIALGGRNHDSDLLRSLPGLLTPFASLSPALDAIAKNAIAAYRGHVEGQYDLALEIWREVFANLEPLTSEQVAHVDAIRNAVAYAIGMLEARNGLASAVRWADRLERDPMQRVGALQLRKIIRMEQGDRSGADKLRRQAEVLALQMQVAPMFSSLLVVELSAAIKAQDLDGTLQAVERIRPLAHRHAGWRPYLVAGEAAFALVSGDNDKALAKFDECFEMCRPDPQGRSLSVAMWVAAHGGAAEALFRSDRFVQAREVALRGLAFCEARNIRGIADDLIRTLALAEVKLGNAAGVARLDALIAEQRQLGVSGLHLGCSYEARALIALWQHDAAAFERYGELTGREYRYGAGSPLGARYEDLMSEATRRGVRPTAALASFETRAAYSSASRLDDRLDSLWRSMLSTELLKDRAETALQLVCVLGNAAAAHLYLVTGDALSWVASHGAPRAAQPELADVQRRFDEARRHAHEISEMQTGDLADEQPTVVRVDGTPRAYGLMLLTRVEGSQRTLAGAIAIERAADAVAGPQRERWLRTLAAHFLDRGDTLGLRSEVQPSPAT